MKRKLSLLMVLMMMLSLIPANMAFAGSKTDATTTVTASDGTVEFGISIEPTVNGLTSGGIFELRLGENAEWVAGTVTVLGTSPVIVRPGYAGTQRVEFQLTNDIATGSANRIGITAQVKLDGATDGEQKVTIENVTNSGISREVLTYAVVSGTGKIMSRRLTDVQTLTREGGSTAQFEIREVNATGFDTTGVLKFRLPKDISWKTFGTSIEITNGSTGNTRVISPAPGDAVDGGRTLEVTVVAGDLSSKIDRIVVKPSVNISRDARLGDIEVETRGIYSADSVKVAEYKDFGITLKVDKVKEIIAGQSKENSDYTVKVTLDPAGDSFIVGRPIDFTVKNGKVKLKGTPPTVKGDITSKYADEFEVVPAFPGSKIEFELYLNAGWDKAGDLTLTGKGGGMEEQTIKLADVLAPAKITTKVDENKTVADVVVGLQNQATPEITITETEAGSLQEGYYVFDLNQARYNGVEFIDSNVKFETTGDISVDDVYTIENGEKLIVYVDGESSKEASTITIKGLQVTLDRTVPFGQLDLRFGAAVADDDAEFGINPEKEKYDVETIIEKVPFLNVVTRVQTARQQKTVFTIDSTTYTVGSETRTLDAAPYISNNRTMLPIGTVAQLAGATLNYSPSTRTAVFTKDNLVVSMNLDTNILLVNGSPVPMDAKPEIVNSRAFVPVVFVAQAFGIQNGTDIVYDAAARTVTLFPNAQ